MPRHTLPLPTSKELAKQRLSLFLRVLDVISRVLNEQNVIALQLLGTVFWKFGLTSSDLEACGPVDQGNNPKQWAFHKLLSMIGILNDLLQTSYTKSTRSLVV